MSNYSANEFITNPDHVWTKIVALVPAGSDVLDIGCSSGNLGRVLIDQKRCRVDGIELDPADAKQAAQYLGKVWQLNIEDTKTAGHINKRYDVLVFADVLEHLVDPVAVLKNVKTLLKPKGKIVFSIPNMAHVSIRLDLLAGRFNHTETGILDKTHLHFYDAEEVARIFAEASLKIDVFDASPYPYPTRLIRQKLENIGLTVTEASLKVFNDPTATAFQYVGAATYEPAKAPAKLQPKAQAIHNDIQTMAEVLEQTEQELAASRQRADELSRQLADQAKALDEITGSKTYKLAQKAVHPYRQAVGLARRSGKKTGGPTQ